MMAAVGGRMESVAPRQSLYAPDYLRLAALVAVSAAVHLWLIGHTAVTARDSIGFARYALSIQSPYATPTRDDPKRTAVDVIQAAQHPPGYPLAVWATAKFVRHATDLPLPDSTLLAAQIANALAALLLVVPTYLTGRMLFGRFAGFAAALLVQVLPVPARLTADGLSEGVYLLAAGVAVMLAVRAVRRPGVGTFLACGLAVGATYLVRPEGLLVAGAVGAVAVGLALARRWPWNLTLGRVTALAVGVALVAVPYMLLIGSVTNKPSADHLLKPADNPRQNIWRQKAAANPAVGGPLFAKWMDSPIEDRPGRVVWGVEAVAEETGKSLHYGVAAFALLGLLVVRRRLAAEPGLWVLLVLAGLNAGLLVYLAARVGYVSERHTVLLVLVGCLFAGAALEPVAAGLAALPKVGRLWAGRYAAVGLLAMLVATALPATLKPLHPNREGHKHAGRWLAAHLQPTDCLIDPFEWAQWYAWRSLYFVPEDPPNATVIYSVVENNPATPHSRLPRLDLALDVAKGGTLVYHWPEDGPPEKATVHVYKTVR
jgi:hypothetical protein